MDFLKVLQNRNFSPVTREAVRQKAPAQAPKTQAAKPKTPAQGAQTKSEPNEKSNSYTVKSSKGKEFTRRRKQQASEYYDMADNNLLKAYDDAQTTGDDKKRKRVLYYVKKRGLKVRQMRRKLNGSE